MHITHFTPECAPFAKVGGLADVVLGLSKELVKQGHSVDIFIPSYPFAKHHLPPISRMEETAQFPFGNETVAVTIYKSIYEGIHIYLLELHSKAQFFQRDRIYGYDDDVSRFLAFLKGALETLVVLKKNPPLIHLHDWPTAIAPVLFNEVKRDLKRPAFLLTVHNLSYQGITPYEALQDAGLFSPAACKQLEDLYIPYRFNLLLGGLRTSDHITTVSPTYAKEIETVELGRGLHEIFLKRSKQFTGILNGLDPVEIERYIEISDEVKNRNLAKILDLKAEVKKKLTSELGVDPKAPFWVISVTRLVEQKAPHLIYEAAKQVLSKGGVFILVGLDGDHHVQKLFKDLEEEWQHTNRVRIVLGYNPKLAEQLFAAADFTIIPSHFEPCGLTQLYSLYFATIPIVRKTGGLSDTVFDLNDAKPSNPVNGYTFLDADIEGVTWIVGRALQEFGTQSYKERQKNACKVDISWKNSAKAYLEVYEKIASFKS
ncbi:MAG: glycogen synthase [Chlamydiae bacterium]|nr:glycogen synthase [Chlamydiota bacterium]